MLRRFARPCRISAAIFSMGRHPRRQRARRQELRPAAADRESVEGRYSNAHLGGGHEGATRTPARKPDRRGWERVRRRWIRGEANVVAGFRRRRDHLVSLRHPLLVLVLVPCWFRGQPNIVS